MSDLSFSFVHRSGEIHCSVIGKDYCMMSDCSAETTHLWQKSFIGTSSLNAVFVCLCIMRCIRR
uniref:Uncharacterized protein n=1 Tax=Anguilla anguilla TaxID=7936 RepID=A0A0E9SVP0_ANGAN